MLQDIRSNAQGTIAKIIVVLLVLGLSMFGMDAMINGFSGEPTVATVNGKDVTERKFQRSVQMQRQRQLSQMETPDPSLLDEDRIRQTVMDSLIRQALLTQDAADQGFTLSARDVDGLITSMSQFQVDGQFSQEAFTSRVRQMGMGVTEFRQALRDQYRINQIRAGVMSSSFVTPESARYVLQLQSQTRNFQTLAIDQSRVVDTVSVTEDDIQTYYDNNPDAFKQPERVDVAWLTLSVEALAENVEVSDDALQDRYEQRLSELEGQQQRRAAHILIESGENAEDTLQEVQSKLENGEDFGALAREYSDDPLSAEKGGDLGFAGRGVYEPAFEDALYDLEKGEISEPVETRFGYHLIRLDAVREADKPSFDALRPELKKQIAREKAGRLFSEKRSRLADVAYAEPNLTVPAEELGLEIQTRDGISREGGDAPFDHQGLVRQLYSDDVLNGDFNTEVIEVSDGRAVVARVREHHPGKTLALDAVRDQIETTLRQREIAEALSEEARNVIERLRGGEAPETVAADLGIEWRRHEGVGRSASEPSRRVVSQAFRMPRPDQGQTFDWTGGQQQAVIIGLQSVQSGSVEGSESSLSSIRRFLSAQSGQQAYAAYVEQLREKAEIERN
ncbi:peptidyl-prolyl cis-trans isomerase D [Tamilnaduibacter salinus]|uniref:Periplasmic chaperone PpiD n=1 Tax=Tamilnaduibacter salinus TaxID=1484056 RepID=A0A2A2I5B5_9GAMM|nr:SurA N-terminal domain-containing protein [Tamilnaduibacter salinus]PAV26772.1 peptidylprolyl isomerase [Tamilnaduibacter salinus]PVY75385.1 peptidyl-prolyl cis-trans isomerase D [Tamilnaduibacter salinus]